MLKKIIVSLIRATKIMVILRSIKEADNIATCNAKVTNKGGFFGGNAKIENWKNDSSKILVGKGSFIRGELQVFAYGGEITIGENSFVGEHSRIWSGESVIIGNNVLISHNVNIIDTNTHEINHLERAESFADLVKNGHSSKKGSIQTSPIIIEDYAWINFNAVILKGVTIGKGAIVAAGTIVTKDVPPFVLIGGNPAKILKYLNEDN